MPAGCPDCPASLLDLSSMTTPTVFLAGLVDGFNPCAFSIVIILAGILSVGHARRARLWGGVAFCVGSFSAYLAMGLGLLKVLRMMEGLVYVRFAFNLMLSLSLFVLSLLSVRDALNYRRERRPAAILLQLPDGVKRAIRAAAEHCWSGTAVILSGLGCGVVVTLLDSLCTGQVYVPVLALIAREEGTLREFAMLVIYNLAFIAPLVVVFVLSAIGATSERMQVWSKRNVVPSKLALAGVLFVLAIVLFPDVGSLLAG